MRDLEKRDDLLWSFMLFGGYLKFGSKGERRNFYELKIPNEEVRIAYEEIIERWFAEKTESNQLEEMLRALETGDVVLFERMLRLIVVRIMSYHDLGGVGRKCIMRWFWECWSGCPGNTRYAQTGSLATDAMTSC